MKTVRNCTVRPLKVPLPRGKFLHLGPKSTGSVHPDALERPAVKRLLEAGELEIIDDSVTRHEGNQAKVGSAATHGHGPSGTFRRKGDR
jgi:hypothetical protein